MELLSGSTLFKNPAIPLAVAAYDQEDRRFHTHDFSELVLIVSGSGLHLFEGKAYPIRAGDLLVIPQGRVHGYTRSEGLRLINVCFRESALPTVDGLVDSPLYAAIFKVSPFLRREASESARFTPEPSSFGRMVRAVEEMEAELGESSQESLWMAQSLLLRLVVLVLRSTSEGASREGVDYRSSRAYRLGSLVSSLEARPDVSVDVGEMARRSHVSESTLFRSFHRAFGTTPIRYRDKIRMERAAELLLSTARPVVDIALELGFSDGNYFSRRFKTIRGISPGAYRRHAREVLAGR